MVEAGAGASELTGGGGAAEVGAGASEVGAAGAGASDVVGAALLEAGTIAPIRVSCLEWNGITDLDRIGRQTRW